jgi:hypothetical protein
LRYGVSFLDRGLIPAEPYQAWFGAILFVNGLQ